MLELSGILACLVFAESSCSFSSQALVRLRGNYIVQILQELKSESYSCVASYFLELLKKFYCDKYT